MDRIRCPTTRSLCRSLNHQGVTESHLHGMRCGGKHAAEAWSANKAETHKDQRKTRERALMSSRRIVMTVSASLVHRQRVKSSGECQTNTLAHSLRMTIYQRPR